MSRRKRQREEAMQAKRLHAQDDKVLQALQQLARDRAVQEYGRPMSVKEHREFLKDANYVNK